MGKGRRRGLRCAPFGDERRDDDQDDDASIDALIEKREQELKVLKAKAKSSKKCRRSADTKAHKSKKI